MMTIALAAMHIATLFIFMFTYTPVTAGEHLSLAPVFLLSCLCAGYASDYEGKTNE
jgi:hypothetical protein